MIPCFGSGKLSHTLQLSCCSIKNGYDEFGNSLQSRKDRFLNFWKYSCDLYAVGVSLVVWHLLARELFLFLHILTSENKKEIDDINTEGYILSKKARI